MEEAPENSKELSYSVHFNGMNEWMCTKAIITDFKFVRFFTSMNWVMSYKISTIVETFPTLFIFIQFLSCLFKFELSVNSSPQYVREKGLSPVSVSKCLCIFPCYMHPLPHVMQMCSFSPVHDRPCFLRSLPFTQSWHRWNFSPVCIMLGTLSSMLTPGSALFPNIEDWQRKCFQLLAEKYSSLSCTKEKISPILLPNNKKLQLVSKAKIFWENIQDDW